MVTMTATEFFRAVDNPEGQEIWESVRHIPPHQRYEEFVNRLSPKQRKRIFWGRVEPAAASYTTIVDNRIFDLHWKKKTPFAGVAAWIVRVMDRLLFRCNCEKISASVARIDRDNNIRVHNIPRYRLDARYRHTSAHYCFPDGEFVVEHRCSRCGHSDNGRP